MPFFLGLDLGQVADYSALVVVQSQGTAPPHYGVRYLTRWPLSTAYPVIVQDVAAILADPALRGQSTLIADQTGCGRPVVDMLVQATLAPIAVSIHGGDTVSVERGNYRVPKRDLVACIAVLLQQKRLQFAQMPMTDTLVQELLTFRVRIDPATSHDSYSAWRERDHDDLVLAMALAVWWGERQARAAAQVAGLELRRGLEHMRVPPVAQRTLRWPGRAWGMTNDPDEDDEE